MQAKGLRPPVAADSGSPARTGRTRGGRPPAGAARRTVRRVGGAWGSAARRTGRRREVRRRGSPDGAKACGAAARLARRDGGARSGGAARQMGRRRAGRRRDSPDRADSGRRGAARRTGGGAGTAARLCGALRQQAAPPLAFVDDALAALEARARRHGVGDADLALLASRYPPAQSLPHAALAEQVEALVSAGFDEAGVCTREALARAPEIAGLRPRELQARRPERAALLRHATGASPWELARAAPALRLDPADALARLLLVAHRCSSPGRAGGSAGGGEIRRLGRRRRGSQDGMELEARGPGGPGRQPAAERHKNLRIRRDVDVP
eukprot:tig00020996_g16938.t1